MSPDTPTMTQPTLLSKLLHWLDQGQEMDPVQTTRMRGIQVASALLSVFALPWVLYCFYIDFDVMAVSIGASVLASPFTIWMARSGRVRLAGHHVVGWLMFGVFVGVWQRGGLQFSVSSWLTLIPVLSFLFLGLRGGIVWSMVSAVGAVGFWVGQNQGWVQPQVIDPKLSNTLVLLDYACIPAAVAGVMWSHVAGQDAVVAALDKGNADLRAEIAERQRAEERVKAAVRARDQFFATMSHEVRTPLNGVLGLSELLSTTELDPEQAELAAMVQGSGDLLRRLLDDVLDYSKIDGEQLELEALPIHLERLCDGLAGREGVALRERGVRMELDIHRDCPTWVLGDSVRLAQVLGNLISNAAKFTAEGAVTLRARPLQQGVAFLVEDTGIGMSEAEMERIFEPFAQADASTTRRFGGTGLGLAISQGIVKAMGGEIRLRSQPGVGTSFEVRLPLVACPAPTAEVTPARPQLNLERVCVLVAEDNVVNRVVISRFLEALGAEVRLAADGAQCIEAWAAHAPDLILMDCQMPTMDGYQATEAIRARGGTLPIVALTANTSPQDRARSMDAGMDDHLGKPLSMSQLADCLARWVPQGSQAVGA